MIEILVDNLFFIIVGVGMAIIGIVIQQSKSYSMIAGFNTMSAEKRKKINIKQVAIALRNAFILIGLVWIVLPIIAEVLGLQKLKFWLIIGLHFLIIAALIFVINTQSKYKINT